MSNWAVMALVMAALCATACSRPVQQQNKTNAPAANKAVAPKKSYRDAYDRDMPLAFSTHDAWESNKTDANYIEWTVKLHAALKWVNMHRKENGDDSVGNWPKLKDLKELRSGYWKNAKGPMDDPAVKAAIEDWGSTN